MPRSLQATAGLLTATAVAGTTLGGLVGVLSALALGRFGGLGPRASTLAVAAIGFVALYVVPFAAYPPNPPAVGNADTIGLRTALYFVAVAISVIAAVVAVLVGRRLARRWSGWHAALAAGAGYLVVVLIALALLPNYNEVPDHLPGDGPVRVPDRQLHDHADHVGGARPGARRARRAGHGVPRRGQRPGRRHPLT